MPLLFLKNTPVFVVYVIGLICFVCSCSPNFVTTSSTTQSQPGISTHTFTSYDSTKLPLRAWLPQVEPDAVIIAVHGFNDYSNFIKDSALFFNNRNIAVYAYDQRGFGESTTRGRWSGWQALSNDLSTFISLIKKIYPHTPLYILGDSMGGAVTIVTMTLADTPEIDGVILVAPAVWARTAMPYYQRWLLWIAAHTIPWKKVTGEALDITASDNEEMLIALGEDPLVIKETRIDVLYGLSNLMDEAYRSAEMYQEPSLILYGEKDEIIPRKPVFEFYKRLPEELQEQQHIILYENGYHMLLRDLQAETVMKDIADWINEPAKPVSALRNNLIQEMNKIEKGL